MQFTTWNAGSGVWSRHWHSTLSLNPGRVAGHVTIFATNSAANTPHEVPAKSSRARFTRRFLPAPSSPFVLVATFFCVLFDRFFYGKTGRSQAPNLLLTRHNLKTQDNNWAPTSDSLASHKCATKLTGINFCSFELLRDVFRVFLKPLRVMTFCVAPVLPPLSVGKAMAV